MNNENIEQEALVEQNRLIEALSAIEKKHPDVLECFTALLATLSRIAEKTNEVGKIQSLHLDCIESLGQAICYLRDRVEILDALNMPKII